jgi:hypothetical protein
MADRYRRCRHPPAVPADPVEALQTYHDALGLHPTGRTACPLWLGERIDVGWAIGVLHPRVAPRATLRSALFAP